MAKKNIQKFVAVLAVLSEDGIEVDLVKYSKGQEAQALRHLDQLDWDGDRAVLVWGPGAQVPAWAYNGAFTSWGKWGLDWAASSSRAETAWKGDDESPWLHKQPDYLFRSAARAAEQLCLPVKPW